MADDSGVLQHRVVLKKWNAQQTTMAAQRLGIDPDELTEEHFAGLGDPEEEIHVNHTTGQVHHRIKDQSRILTIDEWNREALS